MVGLDPKWVLIHTANLPIASSFVAANRGGIEFRGWGQHSTRLPTMVDALDGCGLHPDHGEP